MDNEEEMCPNCVTPWKCNGPHELPEQAPVATGLRYNKDKPELSMVLEADKAIAGVAKVLMYGRDKYTKECKDEWEGLLLARHVKRLDLYEIKVGAEGATKNNSSTLIQSTNRDNYKIAGLGQQLIEKEKLSTRVSAERFQTRGPCNSHGTSPENSSSTVCQKTFTTNTYPEVALCAAPPNTYILITTIQLKDSEEYFVVNTTTVLDSLETTLQALKQHSIISGTETLHSVSGRGNWLKGLDHMGIVDCLMRHLTAYVSGENLDEESGLPHVDHVLANALFLSQMTKTRHDLDNRVAPF